MPKGSRNSSAAPRRDWYTRARRYAKSVVAGKTPACKWVRLACERQLTDEADPPKGYTYNREAAERPCAFISRLKHVKGEWASAGQRIHLEDWQCFVTCTLFGWIDAKGLRRYRRALILVPRKNGKSLWAAGVGLYMFAVDNEFGAEVYSGATSEKQAWEIFRPAKQIVDRMPELRRHFSIESNAKSLTITRNGSRFEPVIGKPGDGASPSCAIHDEYHEHQSDEQVDTMLTGMGARRQPLQLIVTTAGADMAGPCYSEILSARKVLDGVQARDDLFFVEYTIDDDDEWSTEAALRKANPNFGVSVGESFLQTRLNEAIGDSRKQSTFKTKHLNLWIGARAAFFNVHKWRQLEDTSIKRSDFAGRPCYVGLDLASKVDIASKVLLFPGDTEADPWTIFHDGYLPEETVWNHESEHYHAWARDKWLTVTDGEVTDYDRIEEDLVDDCKTFEVRDIAYDPHQATMLVNHLIKANLPVVEFRPTVLNFSEPMKELDAKIKAGMIRHNGDPVLTWMISNTVAREDAKDNVYPRKEKPEHKIDGVVAAIMALGRGMIPREANRVSVYEAGQV